MICPENGILRARLDHELSSAEMQQLDQHLASCSDCNARLAKLLEETSRTNGLLANLASSEQAAVDAHVAYGSLRTRIAAESLIQAGSPTGLFAPRWRAAWGLLAAILIVSVFVVFDPARTWAQKVLAMLRVQKIRVVSIDPSTLTANGEPDARPYRLINQFISDNVVVTIDPGKPNLVPSTATGSQLAGFRIRTLSSLGDPRVQINGEAAFQMNLNRERIGTLLEEVGRSDIQIPESVDGALVAVHIPKSVISMYGDCPVRHISRRSAGDGSAEQQKTGEQKLSCVYFIQAPSPTVSMPPDLKMAEIAEAGLQLAGMSASEAHAFCQTVDWSSTLVVPVPHNSSSQEKVTVDGVEGTLITETLPQASRYSLLWIKQGVIYSLMGRGDSSQALSLANSLN
jgi:hypothetical protein